jgi:hypothetical protein
VFTRYFPTPYLDASKAFADGYPSETFRRDPKPCQPVMIYGSDVSEGYPSAKADPGKTME